MSNLEQAGAAGEPAPSAKPDIRSRIANAISKGAEIERQALDPNTGFISQAEAVSARSQAGEPVAKSELPADIEPDDAPHPDAPDNAPTHKADESGGAAGEPDDADLSSLGLSPDEVKALRALGYDTSKLGVSDAPEGEPEGSDPFADLDDHERAPYAEFGGNSALMSKEIYHLRQAMAKREQSNSELVEYVKAMREKFNDFRGGRSFDESAARARIKEELLDEGLDEKSSLFGDLLDYRASKAKAEFDSSLPPDIPEVEQWVERVNAERQRAKEKEDERMQAIWDATVDLSKRGTNGEELPLLQQFLWQAYSEKPTSDGRVLLARAQPALEKEMARHILASPIVSDELKAALRVRARQLEKRPPAKFTPGSAAAPRTADEPSAPIEDKVRRTSPQPSTQNNFSLSGAPSAGRQRLREILSRGATRAAEQDRRIFGA